MYQTAVLLPVSQALLPCAKLVRVADYPKWLQERLQKTITERLSLLEQKQKKQAERLTQVEKRQAERSELDRVVFESRRPTTSTRIH